MERLIQLLDDLDDLVGAFRLLSERIRYRTLSLIAVFAILALQAGGVILAVVHPPLAMALAMLLLIGLLYHSVTAPHHPLEIV
ncbi:MAG: hypothetical protein GWN47_03645 [Woeseiaceae bacterium]|nr:hypothetical protein [Woeseiaceae bacterium]